MKDGLRILHSPTNIANQMSVLARAQRSVGYYSRSCNYANNWFGYKCDESLNLEQLANVHHRRYRIGRFFLDAIVRYNVFHFHFGNTLLPRNYDLPLLKSMNKRMVMHYWGSEIRQKSIAERKNRFVKVKKKAEKPLIDRIKRIAKYIGTAVVGDYESYEYIEKYFDRVVIARQSIDLQEYKAVIPSLYNRKPLVVHAPTAKGPKGTEHVLNAVSKLSDKYDFEFTLVSGLSHKEAKKIYTKADIIVDQLLSGAHGVFSVEAMALGKPVICYIREDLKDKYPEELPIISANPETIYDVLKLLVEDAQLRHGLGEKGRAYVEKYHDAKKIAKELIKVYRRL